MPPPPPLKKVIPPLKVEVLPSSPFLKIWLEVQSPEGRGDPKQNKSFQVLLRNINPLVPLQLLFFEKIAAKLESFLRRFQTSKPMVSFLVSHLEAIIREICSNLILDDVVEDARSTRRLVKRDVTDKSIQKVTSNLGFSLKSDLRIPWFMQKAIWPNFGETCLFKTFDWGRRWSCKKWVC